MRKNVMHGSDWLGDTGDAHHVEGARRSSCSPGSSAPLLLRDDGDHLGVR